MRQLRIGLVFAQLRQHLYSEDGKLLRKTVSAKTKGEALQKLKGLQKQLDDGLPAPDDRMTVPQLLTRWHDDVLRHQVR